MGGMAQGTPLVTIIKQAHDLVDLAKQRLEAKAATPSKSARSNHTTEIHAPKDLIDQWATGTMLCLVVETSGSSWMQTAEVRMPE